MSVTVLFVHFKGFQCFGAVAQNMGSNSKGDVQEGEVDGIAFTSEIDWLVVQFRYFWADFAFRCGKVCT